MDSSVLVASNRHPGILCMDCEHVRAALVPFLDGELPDREAGPVTAHLQECLSCARLLRAQADLALAPPLPCVDTREPGFWDDMDVALSHERMSQDRVAFGVLGRPVPSHRSLVLGVGLGLSLAWGYAHWAGLDGPEVTVSQPTLRDDQSIQAFVGPQWDTGAWLGMPASMPQPGKVRPAWQLAGYAVEPAP